MSRLFATLLVAVFLIVPGGITVAQQNVSEGQARVLRGIPAIAQAFAPLAGVKWQEFAQVLAGICAVESTCSPTYPHYASGRYSQYQGLFQMNESEVNKAEGNIRQMLPQIQALAQSGQLSQEAYKFVEESIRQGMAMSGDKRFHPEYGVILGAVKHIQINKQLADRYPGQPVHQAAGHMTAQFSGIVEGHIRNRNFNAPISSAAAWALGQNKVAGGNVAGAIESAGATYGKKMQSMMARLAQVTNNMSLIPTSVEPFNAPPFRPGEGGRYPNVSHGPISELLESGFVKPNDARVQENFPNANQGATSVSPTQSGSPSDSQSSTSGVASGIGPSASTLVMQATSALPGATVLVAWSSVGMQSKSCSLGVKDSTPFIQGENEGSQRFELPSSASSGSTLILELKCTSSTGQSVVKGASIAIE
jgi:hypothetical protein